VQGQCNTRACAVTGCRLKATLATSGNVQRDTLVTQVPEDEDVLLRHPRAEHRPFRAAALFLLAQWVLFMLQQRDHLVTN